MPFVRGTAMKRKINDANMMMTPVAGPFERIISGYAERGFREFFALSPDWIATFTAEPFRTEKQANKHCRELRGVESKL